MEMHDTPLPSSVPAAQPAGAESVKRILIIDPSSSSRRLLSTALLAEGGCDVSTANDSAEARAHLSGAREFDLLIVELQLSDTDGCQLIRAFRTEGVQSPILALSTRQTADTLAQVLEAGADDLLQKPLDLVELRRAISTLLARRDRTRPQIGGTIAFRALDEGSFVELTVPTNSAQIESFQRLAERLVVDRVPHATRMNLRLALEEMIQNAKEWGNKFDASKRIRLAYCLLSDRIVFRVEDEGEGFEPYNVPDPSINPREHIKNRISSGKRMGGWGLFMTRKLMDEVVYNDVGNVVYITKRFDRPETPKPDLPLVAAAPREERRAGSRITRRLPRMSGGWKKEGQ